MQRGRLSNPAFPTPIRGTARNRGFRRAPRRSPSSNTHLYARAPCSPSRISGSTDVEESGGCNGRNQPTSDSNQGSRTARREDPCAESSGAANPSIRRTHEKTSRVGRLRANIRETLDQFAAEAPVTMTGASANKQVFICG
jgi:hypothetical protein